MGTRSFVDKFTRQPMAAKVPEIGALFWVVKLFTTAGGESISDFLGDHNVVLGGVIELVVLALPLWWQFRTRRYQALAYWSLALGIAITGTGISDTLHIAIGVPYVGTTVLWAVVLGLVFWRWQRAEGTLSIHSIVTRRREAYYWATVFATFALGTALGDFTATAINMGYLASGIMFGVAILVPLAAWYLGLDSVFAFWWAYVITRPLGASFSDYVSKPHSIGGIDFGDGHTAAVALLIIAMFVGYLALARRDIQSPAEQVGRPDSAEPPHGAAGALGHHGAPSVLGTPIALEPDL